jgi:hypothetical protein
MIYYLDACALIALLKKENGAEKIMAIYEKAAIGEAELRMSKLNLFEAYYDQYRSLDSKRRNVPVKDEMGSVRATSHPSPDFLPNCELKAEKLSLVFFHEMLYNEWAK